MMKNSKWIFGGIGAILTLILGILGLKKRKKKKALKKKEEEALMRKILMNQKKLEAACEQSDITTEQAMILLKELKIRLDVPDADIEPNDIECSLDEDEVT